MAVPTVTPTTPNYPAVPGDHIPLSNLFSAKDTVNGEVIRQWVFKEDATSPHGFLYIEPTSSSATVFQPDTGQWVPVKSGLVAPGHDVSISSTDLISGNLVYLAPESVPIGQSVSATIGALAGDASGWSSTVFTTVTTTLSPFQHHNV